MKLFFVDRVTPVLALACAALVFIAAALDQPDPAPGAPAVTSAAR